MTARIAVLSDVHGNAAALDAVRKAIKAVRPEAILVCGDLVMNGPEPGATVDALREMETAGAIVVQGNTDVAVADFDFSAAFPSLVEGVPDSYRAAAEWAHEQLSDEQLAWLRRLPAERRLWIGDTLVLACHASPGSQTQGFDQGLDPGVVYERVARTDARVICCGHTHMPEVRELGRRLIVNDGSAGYVFDGDPTASWALVTIGDVPSGGVDQAVAAEGDANADAGGRAGADEDDDESAVTTAPAGTPVDAEIKRTPFDALSVANAISSRGLPGDVYRAATVRTGKHVR
ncbi:MAG TPA: metallophosphoesterase family protein [Candidatus Limnocylindrales bacterium]|nr:metallophosphoesterase family protein [Candidatus Limnocylindrales bacterium]